MSTPTVTRTRHRRKRKIAALLIAGLTGPITAAFADDLGVVLVDDAGNRQAVAYGR